MTQYERIIFHIVFHIIRNDYYDNYCVYLPSLFFILWDSLCVCFRLHPLLALAHVCIITLNSEEIVFWDDAHCA